MNSMKNTVSQPFPLNISDEEMEKHGLMVIENVTGLPTYEEPLVSSYLIICLNNQGCVEMEYDMQPVTFRPHDISVVYPNHILTAHSSSDDYQATLLIVSPRLSDGVSLLQSNLYHFHYHLSASFHLSDQQHAVITNAFSLLKSISQMERHPSTAEILTNQMKVTTQLINIFYQQNCAQKEDGIPAQQQLLYRFYHAIVEHYRESHQVQFYADLLCLTPKYFGSVIKTSSGISAPDWIARYVIIQARNLLRNYPDMSIQQITDELGFPDNASFTRYFKRGTGLSPSDYREQALEKRKSPEGLLL